MLHKPFVVSVWNVSRRGRVTQRCLQSDRNPEQKDSEPNTQWLRVFIGTLPLMSLTWVELTSAGVTPDAPRHHCRQRRTRSAQSVISHSESYCSSVSSLARIFRPQWLKCSARRHAMQVPSANRGVTGSRAVLLCASSGSYERLAGGRSVRSMWVQPQGGALISGATFSAHPTSASSH